MARKKRFPDKLIIEALKKAKGHVYVAAEAIGCHADTIYERVKTSPAVAEVLRQEDGKVNDMARLKLYEAIMAGTPWAIMFRLSRRDPEFREKHDHEVTQRVRKEIIEEIVDAPDPANAASNPPAPGSA